jgi:hypothetical protein
MISSARLCVIKNIRTDTECHREAQSYTGKKFNNINAFISPYFLFKGFQLNSHLTELLINIIIASREKDMLNCCGKIKCNTRNPAEI